MGQLRELGGGVRLQGAPSRAHCACLGHIGSTWPLRFVCPVLSASATPTIILSFPVAMTREHYPERIPFRLTRMLIAAMEVSGIEGNYRSTCDSVMKVLREVGEGPPSALPVLVLVVAASFRCLTATRVPVLGVLRLQHRDSVMAMLEAFVHDPLINWRLLKPSEASGTIL
jgi:hypothetical protein